LKTDLQLKADVNAELAWDPAIHAATVGIAVKDGIVTASGLLDTYAEKFAVERAIRRVAGVRGIALDLEVRLNPEHRLTDAELADAAAHALRWNARVPAGAVRLTVEDGRVTLEGEVEWAYQVASAEQCVRPLRGVRGVVNHMTIRPRASAEGIAGLITEAFERHAHREAARLHIDVAGSVVTLRGKVGSLAEHKAAIGTALSAPGVSRVVDKLEILG